MTNTNATERHATPEEWIALTTNSKSLGLHAALNAGRRCFESLEGTTRILAPVEGVTRALDSSAPATASVKSTASPGEAVLAEIAKETPSAVSEEMDRVFGRHKAPTSAHHKDTDHSDILAEAARLGEAR